MMVFNDEDLKRLKDRIRWLVDDKKIHQIDMNEEDILSLIARLEAAEALLPAWQQQNGESETRKVWCDALEAWRKAAGK